ncbi:hypothetical protein [Ekhidna sp.]|uniref:hypothetical protein n=1 Tax=Ekhidna sp. TaxID=2608089 RepID=UPI003B5022E4
MEEKNPNDSKKIHQAQLNKITAETKKIELEQEKIKLESEQIKRQSKKRMFSIRVIEVIAGIAVMIPAIWWYYKEFGQPMQQAKEIQLSLENAIKERQLDSLKVALNFERKINEIVKDSLGKNSARIEELIDEITKYENGSQMENFKERTDIIRNNLNMIDIPSKVDSHINKDLFLSLGIEIVDLSAAQKIRKGINDGVGVSKVSAGFIQDQTEINKGFIIEKIDIFPAESVKYVKFLLRSMESKDQIRIHGIDISNTKLSYVINLN